MFGRVRGTLNSTDAYMHVQLVICDAMVSTVRHRTHLPASGHMFLTITRRAERESGRPVSHGEPDATPPPRTRKAVPAEVWQGSGTPRARLRTKARPYTGSEQGPRRPRQQLP